jgi:hypothetical protein
MSIRRPAAGSRSRAQLRDLFVAAAYDVSERANGRLSLDAVLRIRVELLTGRREIELVDPVTAARLLGDRDAILGYAESLAAEAAARRETGEDAGAQRLEERALAVVLASARWDDDTELSAFVDGLRRRAEL